MQIKLVVVVGGPSEMVHVFVTEIIGNHAVNFADQTKMNSGEFS